MDYKQLYTQALIYANTKHNNQFRKVTGERYIFHPIRVSERVHTDLQKVVALLHDTIEDTDATFDEIACIFGFRVAQLVGILTHQKGERYDDYITRVLSDGDAIKVKIADICDNLNDYPSTRMIEKSFKALPRLYRLEL